MILWSAVFAGAAVDEAAADDLRDRLAAVLGDPRYGTGLHLMCAGSAPPVPVLATSG